MHTCVPLKSKCLTANNLKCITHALDVPSSSSSDEIRTLVDGKLAKLGTEPHNTQVWCGMIELANADGGFLQIEKEDDFPLRRSSEDSDTNSLGDASEVQALPHEAESRHDTQEEVRKLTERFSCCCK